MYYEYFYVMGDCCLTPSEEIFFHILPRTWDDVRVITDKHAELNIYSASSLKQHSVGWYIGLADAPI